MFYKTNAFSISLLFLFFLCSIGFAAPITNDSTFYYLGSNVSPLPNGAPPAQGVKQAQLVSSGSFVAAPSCPPNYSVQIYVTPVVFSGVTSYGGGTATGPLYGVFANANPTTSGTTNGWNVNLFTTTYGGSGWTISGNVVAITQCCNPNVQTC